MLGSEFGSSIGAADVLKHLDPAPGVTFKSNFFSKGTSQAYFFGKEKLHMYLCNFIFVDPSFFDTNDNTIGNFPYIPIEHLLRESCFKITKQIYQRSLEPQVMAGAAIISFGALFSC